MDAASLIQFAFDNIYMDEEADEFLKGFQSHDLEERESWIQKGVCNAFVRIKKYSKIPIRMFHHFYSPHDFKPGYLVAFCSTIRLEDDPHAVFTYKTVSPKEHMEAIRDVGDLLGYDKNPGWYIPDQAHALDGLSR